MKKVRLAFQTDFSPDNKIYFTAGAGAVLARLRRHSQDRR